MANRTARMENIGSALLVGGEVEWEMKLRKEGKLAFKHAVFCRTISMGISRGGLEKTIPFPSTVFLVIKCFVCQIFYCLISGFFFLLSFFFS